MAFLKRSTLLLVLIFLFAQLQAQETEVDKIFEVYNKPTSPGAAVAVVKGNEIIFTKGYGMANLEYDIPNTPSTVFHIASISKQFTVYAVLLLEQEGKLSIDDDVRKYIPEVPDFGSTITLRHLATHTSGMRDQWALLSMAGWRLDDVITKDQVLKLVSQQKELNFEPGEEYLYCNTGFTLLAEVVARVSKKTFAEFTEERIFQPLKMNSTLFYDDHEKIVKNRAYSYSTYGSGFKKRVLSYANVGATSLFTTVEDLSRWAMFMNHPSRSQKSLVDKMTTKAVLNNGKTFGGAMGQFVYPYKGISEVSHGGADAGYRTYLARYPEQDMAVIVFSNLGEFQSGDLAHQVADIFLADQLNPSINKEETDEGLALSDDLLKSYAGRYEIEPGMVMTITKRRSLFYGRRTWGDRNNLKAISETTFQTENGNATITFVKDADGKATAIEIKQGEEVTTAPRVGPFDRKAINREEYTGSYYSEELQTTYRMIDEGNKLMATHSRHPDFRVGPLEKDVFSGNAWFMKQIHFVRDDNNQVIGMRVSNGRVRDLWFEKMD